MTDNLPQQITQTNFGVGMPSEKELQMLQIVAKNAQDSGLYAGVGQQSRILMVLLSARELGISPMLALNGGIWNINGKIEISARLMNGLIRRAGHSIKIVVSTDETCVLLGTRSDGDSFQCEFSMADATKAGLSVGNVWKKYPADMLYNRCMSRLARRLFSDVIGNSYIEGEIREAKEVEKTEKLHEKNLIQAEFEDTTPKPDSTIHHPPVDIEIHQEPEEPKVNEKQFSEIEKLYDLTNEKFKENFRGYMRDTWRVNEFENIPARYFDITMTAMKRNIENQKSPVQE